jgi:hypothetical protein
VGSLPVFLATEKDQDKVVQRRRLMADGKRDGRALVATKGARRTSGAPRAGRRLDRRGSGSDGTWRASGKSRGPRERDGDPLNDDLEAAVKRVGELSMKNELLRKRCPRGSE